jgi:hypothetical protein
MVQASSPIGRGARSGPSGRGIPGTTSGVTYDRDLPRWWAGRYGQDVPK